MDNQTAKTHMEYDVPARDLWEAITNPTNFKKWYMQIPHFTTVVGESFEFYESEAKKYLHRCTVIEFVPGKKFKHTWAHPDRSQGNSLVTWEVESLSDNRSSLTLTHEGLENFADGGPELAASNYQMGWDAIIQINLRNYLYLIERLHFSININAPLTKVWETIWSDTGYRAWTSAFCEGSYYTGTIEPGARIHFMSQDGSGMYSDVLFYIEKELVIFKHIGEVKQHKEQPIDQETSHWTGCLEIYRFMVINASTTEVECEVDCTNAHIEYMKKHFPHGLELLKEISER